MIFGQKSAHTVFFSPNPNIFYEHYSTYIYVPICVYTNVPQTSTILHRSHSHNNVLVQFYTSTVRRSVRGHSSSNAFVKSLLPKLSSTAFVNAATAAAASTVVNALFFNNAPLSQTLLLLSYSPSTLEVLFPTPTLKLSLSVEIVSRNCQ